MGLQLPLPFAPQAATQTDGGALEPRRDDMAEELAFALELIERNGREAHQLTNAHRRQKRAAAQAEEEAAPPRRGPLARSQALPVADEAAARAPRGERGHVLAVAVTLVNPHADLWQVTARPPYGHASAWRNTLRALAAIGRTRAYDTRTPRRCTWDSLDGEHTL